MRDALLPVCNIDQGVPTEIPDHLGLAYDAWAPVVSEGSDRSKHGKVPDKGTNDNISPRASWLEKLAGLQIAPYYAHAFERWKKSFAVPGHTLLDFTLDSRLLVGHGNPSATEVGLTVHHTWGAPVITGSALKGLCAHYTASIYGPDDLDILPWDQLDKERAQFQGVLWDGKKIKAGPGGYYRALFGAPDAQLDKNARPEWKTGAARGGVFFHDALYIPGSIAGDRPFAPDVLTVHQKTYYNAQGKSEQGKPEPWPNDYDSPNPVAFLTVRPKAKFLIALSGPEEATVLAAHILSEALREWGVGGKTSLGYGRGSVTAAKEWGAAHR